MTLTTTAALAGAEPGLRGSCTAADDFWNAPFGATRTAERISTQQDAVAFCTKGRALTERSTT